MCRKKSIMKENLKTRGEKITSASFVGRFDEIQEGKVQKEIICNRLQYYTSKQWKNYTFHKM